MGSALAGSQLLSAATAVRILQTHAHTREGRAVHRWVAGGASVTPPRESRGTGRAPAGARVDGGVLGRPLAGGTRQRRPGRGPGPPPTRLCSRWTDGLSRAAPRAAARQPAELGPALLSSVAPPARPNFQATVSRRPRAPLRREGPPVPGAGPPRAGERLGGLGVPASRERRPSGLRFPRP